MGYHIKHESNHGERYVIVSKGTAIYTASNVSLEVYRRAGYTVTFETINAAQNIVNNIHKYMGFKTRGDWADTANGYSSLEIIEV